MLDLGRRPAFGGVGAGHAELSGAVERQRLIEGAVRAVERHLGVDARDSEGHMIAAPGAGWDRGGKHVGRTRCGHQHNRQETSDAEHFVQLYQS